MRSRLDNSRDYRLCGRRYLNKVCTHWLQTLRELPLGSNSRSHQNELELINDWEQELSPLDIVALLAYILTFEPAGQVLIPDKIYWMILFEDRSHLRFATQVVNPNLLTLECFLLSEL